MFDVYRLAVYDCSCNLKKEAAMNKRALELYSSAFSRSRMPRSSAYKAGVRDTLQNSFSGNDQIVSRHPPKCPYEAETAEADAWYAGAAEAFQILRSHAMLNAWDR